MRNFNDFDENFRFLMRSKTDNETKKEFDLEVNRASQQFIKWYTNGNTVSEAMTKLVRSYGSIIAQVAVININNIIEKKYV